MENKRKLVLSLSLAEGEDVHSKIVTVDIPLPPGADKRDIMDTLQRAACNAFDVLEKVV